MFLAFFLLWVILNGRITGEVAALGAGISAVCYVFFCRLCGTGLDLDLRLFKKLPAAVRLLGVLLIEIVKANWRVHHAHARHHHGAAGRERVYRTLPGQEYGRGAGSEQVCRNPSGAGKNGGRKA